MTSAAEIAAALAAGEVAILPTDTVYGLAASPRAPAAIARVFALKGRPGDKALPVLAASLDDLASVAVITPAAAAVARRFWPGPVTIVVERAAGFDPDLGGPGDGTVAVRIPDCKPALEVLAAAGPLAVTSANRSGAPPATTADGARAAFGDAVVHVLDGGTSAGTPSTVVSLVGGPRLLRSGALDPDSVLRACAP